MMTGRYLDERRYFVTTLIKTGSSTNASIFLVNLHSMLHVIMTGMQQLPLTTLIFVYLFVEPPVWFTEKSPTSITVNWDLESMLSDSEYSSNGHVCECKTTGEVGDLIPDEDCRCVLASLLFEKTTFNFIDAEDEAQGRRNRVPNETRTHS